MSNVNVLIDADGLRAELDSLRERRDDAIDVHLEQLRELSGAVEEIGFELDDQLAEFRFDLVKDSVEQAAGCIESADGGVLRELVELMVIEFPDDQGVAFPVDSNSSLSRPRVQVANIPSSMEFEKLDDSEYGDVASVLRDYVQRCADRIRYLLKYFSEDLWPYVVWAVESGRIKEAENVAADCDNVSRELLDAYEYWIMWLNELYRDDSSNLGDVGEVVSGMTAWMRNETHS